MASEKTLTNLINEASEISDETANNSSWVQWFNNGLDDMADILYFDKEVDVTPVDAKFALPSDFITPIFFKYKDSVLLQVKAEDFKSTGFKIIEDKVMLQNILQDDITPLTVYYYRKPAYLSTATAGDAVDLPDLYTRALVYYGAAQCMLKEDEMEKYAVLMEQYNTARQLIFKASKAKRQGISGAWVVIR